MKNYNKRQQKWEITRDLTLAAQGKLKADLVIKGGKLVNVNTAEIIPDIDVAVKHGRVVLVGQAGHTVGPQTSIIDANGFYLVPGLMDGHIHVESSMVTVSQYARAVLPHGTTAIFMDPHEIANVLGLEGVKLMMREAENLPLKVFTTMPSCVPAAPGFEDAGAQFGPQEIETGLKLPGIIGLGEMMNFPGVLAGNEDVHKELEATLKTGKVITGHYSIPETEVGLQAYTAAGISSCHESTRADEALAKMRLGMYAMLREGSAWHDVKATIKAITETNIDSRFGILVSDDTHPHTLLSDGHLDYVVRRAIREGLNPLRAIQMVTVNTAQYFGVSEDLGSIAPGKCADILLVKDLTEMSIHMVIADGKVTAREGKFLPELPSFNYPQSAKNSVKLKSALEAQDFIIKAPGVSKALCRVMEVIEAQVTNRHRQVEVPVIEGQIMASTKQDLAKLMCLERHGGPGTAGLGLVRGFQLQCGAAASTVAHDSHNLLIMGMNDADMALAGNTLIKCGGGMAVVKNGEILALLPLPIAGLMSDLAVETVAEQVAALDQAWKALGCRLVSPFMTMALLSLPVIPELRLTNRGLVDVINLKFVEPVLPSIYLP
ncbi:adenine deaminase [Desulfofarcimen acetoxidans DSM 771]|uniref:Adenine deaminase n=1 Tax=Desulfofarcimen acetoxidans (strain ATCC 49208 / DSM 771 / KCTC 5769 / VKM B-1644 / 5575) TaxID=485916 RepID=C8W5T9_DESAS|nr:adenine deaminase [Desulfofarcimen acetoxidans]ACV64089.1 adenine deaminase [Desulfofarcimen acetoxidans DSM 771]